MKPQVISFHCVLKTKLGREISRTYNRDVVNMDNNSEMLKGLAKGLHNLVAGEKRRIDVPASEAYGFYDLAKVGVYARELFPSEIRIGDQVRVDGVKGRVVEINPEHVVLDANHPLAGEDLVFEIEAVEARDATPEDLEVVVHEGLH